MLVLIGSILAYNALGGYLGSLMLFSAFEAFISSLLAYFVYEDGKKLLALQKTLVESHAKENSYAVCPHCRSKNPIGSEFCNKCGERIKPGASK
jgi:ribosomal protein L40E